MLAGFFSILLGSIACVDADIVERQIRRPDMGSVTALSQPHRDRKFFLAKDLRDSAFSSESESHAFRVPSEPRRTTGSALKG